MCSRWCNESLRRYWLSVVEEIVLKKKVEPGGVDLDFDTKDDSGDDTIDDSGGDGDESGEHTSSSKRKSRRQPRLHTCRQCQHGFTATEIRLGRYSQKHRVCVRCFIIDKASEGTLSLPSCWGGYEAKNQLCYDVCKVAQGCMIEYIDRTVAPWKLQESTKKTPTFTSIATWALRVAGRPLSVEELAIALEKGSHGRWRRNKNQRAFYDWKHRLLDLMRQSKDAISLNNGFFVWASLWSEHAEENVDLVPAYDKDTAQRENNENLLSPEEILRKHMEDSDSK